MLAMHQVPEQHVSIMGHPNGSHMGQCHVPVMWLPYDFLATPWLCGGRVLTWWSPIAFSEISQGLQASQTITILNSENRKSSAFNELIMEIHRLQLQTCIFNDTERFFRFVEENLKGSVEVTALIFHNPGSLIQKIHERNLAHRLSLYIFYWNAKHLPACYKQWNLRDPLRAAFITNPRNFTYRIYYNQATSSNDGKLKLVNWFDGNNLGLNTEPLLPDIKHVFKSFNSRHFVVPITHSPPWIFINYMQQREDDEVNLSTAPVTIANDNDNNNIIDDEMMMSDEKFVNETKTDKKYNVQDRKTKKKQLIVSGRDDVLLKLLADKMNFKFEYIDVKMMEPNENVTMAADFVFGDIVVTYERMQEVEFSFFTLPDSGAFLTHAPRRLSEAFALVYPFQMEVWPALIFTIIITGPILYFMIIIPEWIRNKRRKGKLLEHPAKLFYNMIYIKEITKHPARKHVMRTTAAAADPIDDDRQVNSEGLLARCVWFTCQIFLRQSATNFPYINNHSVRLFSIILWLSATYVLSDLYSAQLTSQLARPSKELPINSLYRLEYVLNRSNSDGYKLLVERDSASHHVLMNGTGIMQRLYRRMTAHTVKNSHLLDSVEQGVRTLLMDDKTVVFAGRQTLFFNMKRYGVRNFQLSEKLFTRYSAISLQKGCLFLDSLNENLMKLFEGGILDKITSDEYERMFQSMQVLQIKNDKNVQNSKEDEDKSDAEEEETSSNSISGDEHLKNKIASEKELTALSLRMLQGAFYLAIIGYTLAFLVFIGEIGFFRMNGTSTLPYTSITNRLRNVLMRICRLRLHH
ncbi:ionotropic receptor 40a-like [Chironomus tepperi]|uniref:ionotropic receptor 40a-like n=1 Tax=Chironomus tepperi TaxID=113505 RepID=UPI00391F55E9